MELVIILGLVIIIGYYLLYKFINESGLHYMLWLIFSGIIFLAYGFSLHEAHYMKDLIIGTSIIYFLILFFIVFFHSDVLDKIKDDFKR